MSNNSDPNSIFYVHVGDGATTGGFFLIDRTHVKNVDDLVEAERAARTMPNITFNDINSSNGDTRIQLDIGFKRIGSSGVIEFMIDPACKYIIAGNSASVDARIADFNISQFNAIRASNP
ncbi:hypothetical protein GGI09_000410 [Coemansia sp. S100]|nr:hypothetical protein LPJ71_000110 [Coemansia sp. S17]KAJ2097697.1 hypothetical protein GGI16_004491 [Coemansia sp. S142-1]KAJ2103917.1 hypothetical protein GGI09_000410 [Coemansia sp. S100]